MKSRTKTVAHVRHVRSSLTMFLFSFVVVFASVISQISLPWRATAATHPVFNNALAYWRMDDAGGTVTDSAGTANSITTTTTSTGGKVSTARNFNGTNGSVNFGNKVNYSGSAFSIGAWVNLADTRTRHTIVHKDFQYSLTVDGSTGQVSYADSSFWSYADFGWWGNVPLNSWHYIAAVRSGTNVKIYIDGAQVVSKTFGGAITTTTNPLVMGCYAGTLCAQGAYLKGTVDEVGIWSRSLSASDIQTLYNGGNGLSYDAPAPPTTTVEQTIPVSVACQTTSGQICNPPFTASVETSGILRAEYTPPVTHCASIRIHFWIDGIYNKTSSYLYSTAAPNLPSSTGLQDFGIVVPGTHTVGIQAEGQVGGCDSGYLGGWGGSLRIVSSPPVAASPTAKSMLVITNPTAANKFSRNLTEILKSEGLFDYQQVELAQVNRTSSPLTYLQQYQLVILGETPLSTTERQLFRNYVSAGGKLIAMRPDSGIADVFGLSYVGARTENTQQFFAVDTTRAPGTGIANASMQYHGVADNYTRSTATSLANLWNNISTPSANPAVSLNTYGSGQAVAFTFDLAKSIVLMRQGNPNWKDTEGDTIERYRPMDTFARTNGTLWFSPERIKIPQADEQQHFLANIVQYLSASPQPRMWFLPAKNKQVLVNTDDGEDNSGGDFTTILNDVASYGGRMSVYLREAGVAGTSASMEASWRNAGHETGVHMGGYDDGGDYATQYPAYQNLTNSIQSKYGHVSRTVRNHTIEWNGWIDMAKIESRFGTGLDTNYYHYFPQLMQYPGNENGYFTGSGLPQKFIDENGNPLSIYQALTEWPDEWFADQEFGATNAANIVKNMMVSAQNGYYSAFIANIHMVRYGIPSDPTKAWANQVWAYCQANGIPMITAEKLLDFVQARNATNFSNVTWANNTLNYDFSTNTPGQQLTMMVPLQTGNATLASVSLDGLPVAYTLSTIKGTTYALFTTTAARNHVTATYTNSL